MAYGGACAVATGYRLVVVVRRLTVLCPKRAGQRRKGDVWFLDRG